MIWCMPWKEMNAKFPRSLDSKAIDTLLIRIQHFIRFFTLQIAMIGFKTNVGIRRNSLFYMNGIPNQH